MLLHKEFRMPKQCVVSFSEKLQVFNECYFKLKKKLPFKSRREGNMCKAVLYSGKRKCTKPFKTCKKNSRIKLPEATIACNS